MLKSTNGHNPEPVTFISHSHNPFPKNQKVQKISSCLQHSHYMSSPSQAPSFTTQTISGYLYKSCYVISSIYYFMPLQSKYIPKHPISLRPILVSFFYNSVFQVISSPPGFQVKILYASSMCDTRPPITYSFSKSC